jgi:hypothetical protein
MRARRSATGYRRFKLHTRFADFPTFCCFIFLLFPAEDLEGEIEDIELSEGAAAALAASRCVLCCAARSPIFFSSLTHLLQAAGMASRLTRH